MIFLGSPVVSCNPKCQPYLDALFKIVGDPSAWEVPKLNGEKFCLDFTDDVQIRAVDQGISNVISNFSVWQKAHGDICSLVQVPPLLLTQVVKSGVRPIYKACVDPIEVMFTRFYKKNTTHNKHKPVAEGICSSPI